ncbi:hypothetical protein KR059_003059, partial [Drosophila kikkawai]
LCISYMVFYLKSSFAATQGQDLPQECGKLRETQLHNEMEITAADEYTWIGRVGYSQADNPKPTFLCLAVLIHQRYAILPAHCVKAGHYTIEFILFGDWRANENLKAGDCRLERGFTSCSPPPQAVDIEEIAMHPLYDDAKHDYDIAVAKMVRSVQLSEFVQPLCLPPAREIEGNHISRRLEMAGFSRWNHSVEEQMDDFEWRRKVIRHTSSLEFCTAAVDISRFAFTQNHLCGVQPGTNELMSGAPLMDVEVVDGKPRNFYLVGLNTFGKKPTISSPFSVNGFIRILPFRNWILKNIE